MFHNINILKASVDNVLEKLRLKETKLRTQIKDDLDANKAALLDQETSHTIKLNEYKDETAKLKQELLQQYKDKVDEIEEQKEQIRQDEAQKGYTYRADFKTYEGGTKLPILATFCVIAFVVFLIGFILHCYEYADAKGRYEDKCLDDIKPISSFRIDSEGTIVTCKEDADDDGDPDDGRGNGIYIRLKNQSDEKYTHYSVRLYDKDNQKLKPDSRKYKLPDGAFGLMEEVDKSVEFFLPYDEMGLKDKMNNITLVVLKHNLFDSDSRIIHKQDFIIYKTKKKYSAHDAKVALDALQNYMQPEKMDHLSYRERNDYYDQLDSLCVKFGGIDPFILMADGGNKYAQDYVGRCYYQGKNVEKDKEKAKKYYKKSHDKGNVHATYALGVASESSEKESLYKEAQRKGYIEADWTLAEMEYIELSRKKGERKKRNEKLFDMYKKLADKGHVGGLMRLGICYEEGYFGTAADTVKAKDFYSEAIKDERKSREKNMAHYRLGRLYYLQEEYSDAFKHLKTSVDAGLNFGKKLLGCCYYYNLGCGYTPERYKIAYGLFDQAVKDDPTDSQAYYMLGLCYYNGRGVERNEDKAYQHIWEAADKGCQDAIDWLDSDI